MLEGKFQLKSPFAPTGDQPQAIEAICKGICNYYGVSYQHEIVAERRMTVAEVSKALGYPVVIVEG